MSQSMHEGIGDRQTAPVLWVNLGILTSSIAGLIGIAFAKYNTKTQLFGPIPRNSNALVWVVTLVISTVTLNLLSHQLLNFFEWQPDDQFAEYLMASRHHLLTWVAVGLMAPVFEEVFFRGFVYTHLMSYRHGLLASIIFPNLLWCLLHFHQYDLIGLVVLLVMGIIFTLVRWLSGHLIYPLLMHITFNLTTLTSFLLQ